VCDWKIPKTKLSVPFSPSCQKIIDRYVAVTKDTSWIGLLIWQHKYGKDHAKDLSFFENEECVGCTESGTDREKKEGKKYSNGAYEGSMEKGLHYLMMALGGQYEIHNCGTPGKVSVMWDTSPRNAVTDAFSDIMRESALRFGIRYVDERPVGALRAPTPPSNGEEGNASRYNGEEGNTARENKRKREEAERRAAYRVNTGRTLQGFLEERRAENKATRGIRNYSVINDTGFLSRHNLGTTHHSNMVGKVIPFDG